MEIKIDTKTDSKEHIEHMIAFLQKVIAAQGGSSTGAAEPAMFGMFADNNTAESSEPAPAGGMMDMFGNDGSSGDVAPTPEDDEGPEKIELVPY